MGYSKLYYEDYMENMDYWLGDLGVQLPKWAHDLSAAGFPGVSALDFYADLFGDYLQEHKDDPEDYTQGEYAAIAVELAKQNKKGKLVQYGRRTTINNGCEELFDLIDRSDNFCLMSAASYIGFQRKDDNARDLFALVIEIDDIREGGVAALAGMWKRKSRAIPRPTYICASGSGLHAYFVFSKPIPLWPNVIRRLGEIKTYLTPLLWDKPVSKSYNKIQFEPVLQGFRIVGTRAKDENVYAMAFETGEKITVSELNSFLPDDLQLEAFYKSNMTLEQAKEQYPDWYKRRIVNGEEPGHYHRHPKIYFNWIEKVKRGATLGHRYNCLENLCSLAVQCQIPPEQVEADVRDLAEFLEGLTVNASAADIQKHGHFTEEDIMAALRTYYSPTRSAYTRKTEFIAKKTAIELKPATRKHRKQEVHLRRARLLQTDDYPDGSWRNKNGAPTKQAIIQQWRLEHPDGKKADCIRDTGLSKPTVLKWWNT